MSIERAIRMFAGIFILVSVALAVWVDTRFLWFTAFVGANLFQSALTRFCPLAYVLRAFGLKPEEPGSAFSAGR